MLRRSVRFADEETQRSLVVSYDSTFEAGSEKFAEEERMVSFVLSRILPRIKQPTGWHDCSFRGQ